ncbi:MAG: lipopolysaccharide kinase InaA family protein [Pseudomonadota bacterium]
MNIPSGYVLIDQGAACMLVRESYRDCLLAQGIADPDSLIASLPSQDSHRSGRGVVPSIPVAGKPGERMVLRKYLRGGFLRFANKDLFIGRHRPFRELSLTVEAALHGIPTIEILAAVSIKAAGLLYRGYLISKELSSCVDLPLYLASLARDSRATFFQKKRAAIRQAAEIVCRMHDRGFCHGDLNLKNILINSDRPQQMYVIDWDKSLYGKSLGVKERRDNVLRFCRSMAKLARLGIPLNQRDIALFLKVYGGDKKNIRNDLLRVRISVACRSLLWKRTAAPKP